MSIEIVSLVERPDLGQVVAQWQWQEWGRREGKNVEQIASFLKAQCTVHSIPQAVVLLEDGAPAGTATLDHADLEARPDLTPWLANVFVSPNFRGRGHARRLVRHIEAAAHACGIAILYLHTENATALYAGLGWAKIDTADYHGHAVTVMRKVLPDGAV